MVKLLKVSTRDLVLHVLLKYPETPIKPIHQRLVKDFHRKRTRTRIEQILKDLETQDIVIKERGVKDRRQALCSINPDKIDIGFFTIIKDLDGNHVVIYDDEGTIFDTRFKYKIHDLPDESDEFSDKLQKIRDEYFNRDPLTIETVFSNKTRGFNDWGPDSQKLMEDLENALWTWARGAETVSR